MLAGRLRERIEIESGLLLNRGYITNKSIAFGPGVIESPASGPAHFLEPVTRRINDGGFDDILGFGRLQGRQRNVCLLEPAATRQNAFPTAPLTRDAISTEVYNVRESLLAAISDTYRSGSIVDQSRHYGHIECQLMYIYQSSVKVKFTS
jgi:hypothetical protein